MTLSWTASFGQADGLLAGIDKRLAERERDLAVLTNAIAGRRYGTRRAINPQ